jgi:hypothetical protein
MSAPTNANSCIPDQHLALNPTILDYIKLFNDPQLLSQLAVEPLSQQHLSGQSTNQQQNLEMDNLEYNNHGGWSYTSGYVQPFTQHPGIITSSFGGVDINQNVGLDNLVASTGFIDSVSPEMLHMPSTSQSGDNTWFLSQYPYI